MSLLALGSGVASALWATAEYHADALKPVAVLFFLEPGSLPIGVFFGLVIASGMALWARPPWAPVVAFIVTLWAWSAALHTAVRLQRDTDDTFYLIAASLCAGAVGAGLTQLGCAPFVRALRRPARLAATCLVGAVAGLLLYLGQRKVVDDRLLFVIWQPAVAFAIGRGLSPAASRD